MKLSKAVREMFRQAGRAGGLKGSAGLTKAQRVARAKKAVAARQAKRNGLTA